MSDLFQRRRRGRAVEKRSGSQFNHRALSPPAERKGKRRCECGQTLHSFPKTGLTQCLSNPSPAIFSPPLCKQLVPCSPRPPVAQPPWQGLAVALPAHMACAQHTMPQRNLIKAGAGMVFGPATPDPPTTWLMIVVIRYTGSAVHPSLG